MSTEEPTCTCRFNPSDRDAKGHPGVAPHKCPYSEEICDDSETLCTCCSFKEHECLMDI